MAGRERDHSLKPEVVVDGAERGSATYGDGFKGEHRASFSALVTLFFGGTVLVGRRDARRKLCVSLADFFDSKRNPATILFRASPNFGNSASSGPSVGNSGSSGKRASGIFDNSAASGLLGMTSGSASGPSVLPVPKSVGIVEGAGTSFKEEAITDLQLMKAF